jgi:hypothetical protein
LNSLAFLEKTLRMPEVNADERTLAYDENVEDNIRPSETISGPVRLPNITLHSAHAMPMDAAGTQRRFHLRLRN